MKFLLSCLALLTAVAWGQPQASLKSYTFAGLIGVGDDGPAIEAPLRFPTGVVVDSAGNLYIADRGNHRIRKVDPTGTITTIAGTEESGFGGDDGPATEAQLSSPTGIVTDGGGNLYIADQYNHRIRKVDSTGTITTVAGTGEGGFSGDGGPATEAQLNFPTGVAVDSTGDLLREGVLRDAASFPLEANGQTTWLIDGAFPGTDTSDFAGSVRCDAVGEGRFTAVALEMDPGTRVFTTLPVFPIPERMSQE